MRMYTHTYVRTYISTRELKAAQLNAKCFKHPNTLLAVILDMNKYILCVVVASVDNKSICMYVRTIYIHTHVHFNTIAYEKEAFYYALTLTLIWINFNKKKK